MYDRFPHAKCSDVDGKVGQRHEMRTLFVWATVPGFSSYGGGEQAPWMRRATAHSTSSTSSSIECPVRGESKAPPNPRALGGTPVAGCPFEESRTPHFVISGRGQCQLIYLPQFEPCTVSTVPNSRCCRGVMVLLSRGCILAPIIMV